LDKRGQIKAKKQKAKSKTALRKHPNALIFFLSYVQQKEASDTF